VVINLLGAVAVVIYLHQSYSRSVDTTVARTATMGVAAWEEIKGPDVPIDPVTQPAEVERIINGMKAVTGADYGFLLDKETTDPDTYAGARETLGEPTNWDERDTYAMLTVTDEAVADLMQFEVPPSEVPENGKMVGVENGACSKTCHDGVTGEGDYWTVRWSNDSNSRGHAVFPVMGADGNPVATIYAVENITNQANAAKETMMQTLLVVLITLIVSTLTIGALIDLLMLKRLARMAAGIQDITMRVAGGDFDAEYTPDGTTDEIGSFEKFFSDFIHLVSVTLKSLAGRPDK